MARGGSPTPGVSAMIPNTLNFSGDFLSRPIVNFEALLLLNAQDRGVLYAMEMSLCKGVRCPPIFSLSNLINAGWLVRKCVKIYTSFNCWH